MQQSPWARPTSLWPCPPTWPCWGARAWPTSAWSPAPPRSWRPTRRPPGRTSCPRTKMPVSLSRPPPRASPSRAAHAGTLPTPCSRHPASQTAGRHSGRVLPCWTPRRRKAPHSRRRKQNTPARRQNTPRSQRRRLTSGRRDDEGYHQRQLGPKPLKWALVGWLRFFTRAWSEARGQQALKPFVCPSRHVLPAHSPASAGLPPLAGTCSHHPTTHDAPRWPHKNLPELSSKRSCPQYTITSNYITHIQQYVTMTQPNKPRTA